MFYKLYLFIYLFDQQAQLAPMTFLITIEHEIIVYENMTQAKQVNYNKRKTI